MRKREHGKRVGVGGGWKAHKKCEIIIIWTPPNRKKPFFFNEINQNIEQTRYIYILMVISILILKYRYIDILVKKSISYRTRNCWYRPSLPIIIKLTVLDLDEASVTPVVTSLDMIQKCRNDYKLLNVAYLLHEQLHDVNVTFCVRVVIGCLLKMWSCTINRNIWTFISTVRKTSKIPSWYQQPQC